MSALAPVAPEAPPTPPTGKPPAHPALIVAVMVGLLLIAGVGVALGGELGSFALAGLGSAPFAFLAFLTYLGVRRRWARVLARIWRTALLLVLIGISALDPDGDGPLTALTPGPASDVGGQVGALALWVGLALLVGLTGLVRAERALVARLLPLDPDSFVHTVAWTTVLTLTLLVFAPLVALGEPVLLTVTAREVAAGRDPTMGRGAAGSLRDALYGLIWLVPGALVAVGYGSARGARESLVRLGLVVPTRRQVAAALGLAVAAAALSFGLDALIAAIWQSQGWPQTNQETLAELMRFAFSPIGAVVIGVTAGLGEELGVRGALQPRVGLVLSNLLFAGLHGFQYHWDGLLSVFLTGMVFGLIRARSNTTTSAIVHGTYDFLILMVIGLGLNELF
jgi:membrane protease YdiL (CAAX protease family)